MENKPSGYWTKERVFEKAREYKTRSEFAKGCRSAYDAALRNGWLKEMFWFKEGKKPNDYWNIWENVFEEARKYKTREDFKKGCQSAYHSAHKNGWIDELFPKCEKWNKGKHLSEEHKSKISESNINGKLSKAVLQIDKNTNEVIAEFPSVAEVKRQFGFSQGNITYCCLGKRNTCGGFIWKYKMAS